MKAVVYEGPRQVSVKDVPGARIEGPTDVVVRITSANSCGSDLHMYEGRTDFEPMAVSRVTSPFHRIPPKGEVRWSPWPALRSGFGRSSRQGPQRPVGVPTSALRMPRGS